MKKVVASALLLSRLTLKLQKQRVQKQNNAVQKLVYKLSYCLI